MPGLVPGIHVFLLSLKQDVDGRDKPGHDGYTWWHCGCYAARADFLNAAAAILKSSTKRAYSRVLDSASGSRNR